MKNTVLKSLRLALGALAVSAVASAALITSTPVGGVTTTFSGSGLSCSGAGSATISGFGMSADGNWCFDHSDSFGFDANGTWNGFAMIGANSGATAITIDLGGLFSSVGGLMNYAPGYGTPVIAAIASDGTTVLESWDLSIFGPISTPGGLNAGAFRGIQRGVADIAYFRISGSYVGMHDITLDGNVPAVPEPTTFLLFGGGLAALVFGRRRKV